MKTSIVNLAPKSMLQKAIQKRNEAYAGIVQIDKVLNKQDKALIESKKIYLGKLCDKQGISKIKFAPVENDLFSTTKVDVYKPGLARLDLKGYYSSYDITVPVDKKVGHSVFLDKTLDKSADKLQEIVTGIMQIVKPKK